MNIGKGWSAKIGNPGQFTPDWGGHFDRFLQDDQQVYERDR